MIRLTHSTLAAMVVLLCFACHKKALESVDAGPETKGAASSPSPSSPPARLPEATTAAAAVPAGSPPADGKYERVTVDGVTVPMIEVMNGGAIVLVDTDGKKPRSWEEQYKRKRSALTSGQYDLHKTNVNTNDTFEDDPVDKEGLWVIDAKGNLSKH